ncbi:MAG: hypothetical protein WCW36_03070 [Candidatus Paceibacterota bacterium]|jgi:hypothetical protein
MTWHQFFGTLSVVVAVISFYPYLRDILARKTTPHIYSWLVWTILQVTATAAILRENSFWSAAGVLSLGLVSLIVFLLSFKYGTKNITVFDTVCLIGAFIAISVWIFTSNVTLSIILVTIIDLIAFLPTFRKAFEEPHSETIFLYICSAISNLFSVLSITHYSVESTLYVASLVATNTVFVSMVLVKRMPKRLSVSIPKE